MRLTTISPSNRTIKPYFEAQKVNVFYTLLDHKSNRFVLQLYDSASGNKYEIIATQLEWEKVIQEIRKFTTLTTYGGEQT